MEYSYGEKKNNESLLNNVLFAYKRVSKLWPLHILMMFAMIILWFTGDRSELQASFHQINWIVLNVLLLQNWIPQNIEVNSVAWFLSAILFSYIFYPYYNSNKDDKRAFKDVIVLLGVQIFIPFLFSTYFKIYFVEPERLRWFVYYCPLMRSVDFFIGCNLYRCALSYKRLLHNGTMSIFILLAIIATVVPINNEWWWIESVVAYTPASSALVIMCAFEEKNIVRKVTNRFTVYMGDISPYVFLIHMVVFTYCDAIIHYFSGRYNQQWMPFIKATIGVGITILVAEMYKKVDLMVRSVHKSKMR